MRFLLGLLILSTGFGSAPIHAQEPPAKVPVADPAKTKRFLYLVRYGEAKALASVLSQHYKDEPQLQIVPEGSGNALLITAPASTYSDLIQTLEQLDRRPRQVYIEVLMFEVPLSDPPVMIDPKDFAQPLEKLPALIETLSKKDKSNYLRRFQLTTLENQRGIVQTAESKPMIIGSSTRIGGPGGGGPGGGGPIVQNQIQYREVGTVLTATPRTSPDGTISIELKVDDSRLVIPENGVPLGNGVNAAETIQSRSETKVMVESGRAVLVEGVKTNTKTAKVQTIILVGAKVIDK